MSGRPMHLIQLSHITAVCPISVPTAVRNAVSQTCVSEKRWLMRSLSSTLDDANCSLQSQNKTVRFANQSSHYFSLFAWIFFLGGGQQQLAWAVHSQSTNCNYCACNLQNLSQKACHSDWHFKWKTLSGVRYEVQKHIPHTFGAYKGQRSLTGIFIIKQDNLVKVQWERERGSRNGTIHLFLR